MTFFASSTSSTSSRHPRLLARIALGLAVAAAMSLSGPAQAQSPTLIPERLLIVGQAAPGQPWRDGPLAARRDDSPRLAVVVVAREAGRRRPVYVADPVVAPLELQGRRVSPRAVRPWQGLGPTAVRWSLVEPHAWREPGRKAPNGATTRYHTNVSTEPATFGRWIGYDEVTYFETVVVDWMSAPGVRVRPASARPPRSAEDRHEGLGTMRYKVEVRLADGRRLATPGAQAVDRFGMLPSVFRVSIRRDDTFLGYLTSFFLVPEIFGSAGPGASHQTERFVGADCADVLTGALRAMGHTKVRHTHVAGLTRYARIVAGPVQLNAQGRPPTPLDTVKVGDVIRIRYGEPSGWLTRRGWDHVAVLYQDRSDPKGRTHGAPDGRLDGFDLVVHMGHPRLEVEPLAEQSPARIDVLRWDSRRLGPRRRPRRARGH